MSFNYTRVVPEPVAFKTYGFQKVSPADMKTLIMRMQRPTHSSDIGGYFPDGYFKHPHRPTSSLCKRANTGENDLISFTTDRKRPMSAKNVSRLVRRLQAPTMSRLAATGEMVPSYELNTPTPDLKRPQSSEERDKFIRRITRPTTSSNRRDMDKYWNVAINSEYFVRDFSDERFANKEVIEGIVDRVRTPTVASEGGEIPKSSKRKRSVHIDRDKLPLVSGLARTRRVEDIVERLYRPTSSSNAKRNVRTPSETSSVGSRHN